ncbi:tenascin-like [Cotesia glomerata]|uniref:tenascin-like n=1 Tax=Cotesia glomerata TaxID=32391 RepID=UPI001D003988|nr:tenascin-like [Cotesia glomerata]
MVSIKCLIFPIIFRILTLTPIFVYDDFETYDSFAVTECVDHGFLCNPDLENPCCENFTICELYDWPNQYYCLGNGTLQDYCKLNIDCNLVNNTICSKNKCVCAENYTPLNATACGSLIKGDCDVDEQCVAENSHCVNKTCACKPDFTFVTENECALTYTGQFCNSDQDCFDVNRATCSDNHKCTCRENSFARIDNDVCLSLIKGYCTKDSDCVPLNSVCRNNYCTCDYMFIAVSDHECKLSYLGQTCNKNEDCIETNRAMCSEDKKCVCKENHTIFEDAVCVSLVGGYCWRHEDCLPDNTICVGDRCRCKEHYELRSNNHCVRKLLGQHCKSYADCDDIRYAKCSEDLLCVCKHNHYAMDDTTCGSLLNGFCIENGECEVYNSICVNRNCQCKVGFVQESKFRCVSASLNKNCDTDEDCGNIWRSECSDSKVCVCLVNHTVVGGSRCAPLLGEFCLNADDCAPHRSVCFESKCDCQSGFVVQSNTECVPALLGKPCEIDVDCIEINHSKCSKDNVCICRENTIAVSNSSCEPLLGSFCWKNEKCAPDNSVCLQNECRCKPSFEPLSSNCVKLPLGKSCVTDSDCITTSYLKCSRDDKCVCRAFYIEEDQINCRPLLNGICLTNNDCLPEYSECINGKCRCQEKFIPVSNDQCIPVEPRKQCNSDNSCNDRHANCNEVNECECAVLYEKRNGTCMPLIENFCFNGDECFPNHSECVYGLCHCKYQFKAHSNNMCLPIV